MATIGRLNAILSADTAAFTSKLDRARRDLSRSSTRMNRSLAVIDRGFKNAGKSAALFAKSMVGIRGAAVLAAGVAGLGLLTKRSIDTADAIAKTADAIGITTDALQEYRFALDISGVAQEKTDKGLKKFVRNMGELARSSSETQTALKDLDPALLSNLRSLDSVEDQLALAFRALASYTSQSKRAAVAQALFGRSGIDMTVAVKNGIVAFEALRQKARRLGLVIREDLLRNAEDAKDQLTILGKAIGTNVTEAILKAAPQIAALAEQFVDAIPKIVDFGTALSQAFQIGFSESEKLASQIVEITERIKIAEAAVESLFGRRQRGVEVDRLNALLAERERRRELLRDALQREKPGQATTTGQPPAAPDTGGSGSNSKAFLDLNIKALKIQDQLAASQIDTFGDLETVIGRTAEAARQNLATVFSVIETNQQRYEAEVAFLDKTRDQLEASNQLTAENIAILEKGSAAALKRLAESEKSNPILLERAAILGTVATAEERLIKIEEDLAKAVKRGVITEKERNKVLARTKVQMGQVTLEMELQNRTFDLLDSAIRGNINSWQDLGRAALSVLQDIISETLRSQRTLSGSGSSFLSNLTKSGSSILGFLGFAHGGRPPVGETVVVGEQGPELFVADTPGTILSAEERRRRQRRQRGGDRLGTEVTGTPTAVNVTTPSVEADVLGGALTAVGLLGGGFAGTLFGAVRRGVFGTFGVVRGGSDPGQAPPFGSDLFGREIAAARTARDMEAALAGARGLGAIARGLADDTAAGDEFGLSPGHPDFGGGESGTGGAGSSGGGGGGRAGSAGTSSPGGIGGFEHGGRPPVGQIATVGERGPELFVPDVAGQIIPNAALGSGQITNHFNINAPGAAPGVGQEIDRALQRAVPLIIKSSVNAVVDARRRNPALFR